MISDETLAEIGAVQRRREQASPREDVDAYRAYAEVIGRCEFEEIHGGELVAGTTQPWSDEHPMYRTYFRSGLRRAKALAAAGLLPNRIEYRDLEDGRQQRHVTAWTKVPR